MATPHTQRPRSAADAPRALCLVLLLVTGLGTSCAKPWPVPSTPAPSRPYPVTLGLSVPEQVRNAVHQGTVLFTPYTINVGQETLTLLTAELRHLFHEVVLVPDTSSPDAATAIRLRLEPFLRGFDVATPPLGLGTYRATITAGARVYDAGQQVVFETSGTWTGVSRAQGTRGPQAAAREALHTATAHMLDAIATSAAIRALASASPGLAVYEEGKALYFEARFAEAIATLGRAITLLRADAPSVHRDHILSHAYVLTGAGLIATGAEARARAAFRQAVQLRPQLHLDPGLYAPKIRRLFAEVKAAE